MLSLLHKFVTYITIINTFLEFLINTCNLRVWCNTWDGQLLSVIIGCRQSPYFHHLLCTWIHMRSAILSFYSQAPVWDWSRARRYCYKKLYCLKSPFFYYSFVYCLLNILFFLGFKYYSSYESNFPKFSVVCITLVQAVSRDT